MREIAINFTRCFLFLFAVSLFTGSHVLSTPGSAIYSDKKIPKIPLAIVAIFRDEADYLKEWIEFHKLVGVRRFYLYNNLSKDHYKQVLAPYIKTGEVVLTQWPKGHSDIYEFNEVQTSAYSHAVKQVKHQVRWLAMIDIDEFLVPVNDEPIETLIRRIETSQKKVDQLQLQWVLFGTFGVDKVPADKLMIEVLLGNDGGGKTRVKSIFRPDKVRKIDNPHYAIMKKKSKTALIPLDDAQINHYKFRDLDFFYNVKLDRCKIYQTLEEVFAEEASANNLTHAGTIILRYIPELRKNMGLDKLSKTLCPSVTITCEKCGIRRS